MTNDTHLNAYGKLSKVINDSRGSPLDSSMQFWFLACLASLFMVSSVVGVLDKQREKELEILVQENNARWRHIINRNPEPPCNKFHGKPSNRGAEGHPYSSSSREACELGCRRHLGDCYAGWYGDENGYALTSMPPQFYCHCCETMDCRRNVNKK